VFKKVGQKEHLSENRCHHRNRSNGEGEGNHLRIRKQGRYLKHSNSSSYIYVRKDKQVETF